MPDMDGWVVCQRIREITDVPIILLTQLNQDEEVVRGLEPMTSYLSRSRHAS